MKEIVEYMARLGNFKGFGAKFVMLTSMDGQNLVNVRGGGGGAAVDGGGDGGADGGDGLFHQEKHSDCRERHPPGGSQIQAAEAGR